MKTSLVSSPASALASASATIRADRPQQLKSITVYWRGRKMVLMQRPQRRLSLLLCGLLRHSMRSLFGSLPAKLGASMNMSGTAKRVLSAGALCALALASATTAHATATVDTLPVNTLPDGYTVKYGQVGIGTNGNQMNVNIGTDKAIINWNSFSIGSQAGVDFHFNNATTSSSVLNRVTGNDPSKIMGSLTSNGKVFLINSAGILVGKTARIDVAGFVASTLNISDSNFLAGRMMFESQPGSTAGVMIEEDGSIKTSEGGSVYLIGANVENRGIITSPGGEVLLAAGESVELVDTGMPGVKIVVKGDKGKVKNLGKIIAKAGTIGFGAALIENDGMINASSVDKIGGRIFLRASKDLATTATSTINADGIEGGHVVLYADDSANIDGDVSALGNVDGKGGKGGYVDTSGRHQLAVKYVPRIGKGGEWYIDPSSIDIVQSGGLLGGLLNGVISIITGTGSSSSVLASTITDLLNAGTSVIIVTGDINSGGGGAGDITVHTNIVTSNASGDATLKMNAARNINILNNVVIGDGGQTHKLRLEMVAGYTESGGVITPNHGGAIQASNATITVGGGFEAHAATYGMTGGSLTSSGPFTMDAALTTGTGANGGADIIVNNTAGSATLGAVTLNGGSTLTFNGGTAALGATAIDGASALTVQNAAQVTTNGAITGTGTLNLGANGADASSLNAGANAVTLGTLHQKSGALSGTAGLTVAGTVDQTGGTISFHDVSLTQNSGALAAGNITATDTLYMTANNGAISQRASTSLAAARLYATATSGINLGNTTNTAAALTANNTGSGNIAYSGTGNLALGVIDNGSRSVNINATSGSVSQTGAMTAGAVSVSAVGGITLTDSGNHISQFDATNTSGGNIAYSGSGDLSLGAISNANRNVTIATGNGAISQTSAMTAGVVSVSAANGITLTNAGNNVAEFGATNSTAGNIALTTAGGVTLKQITNSAAAGDISVNAGGALSINGALTTGHEVSLTSTSAIMQANLAAITAASLVATAHGGIDLLASNNQVGSFAATNYTTGNISFMNNHGQPSGSVLVLGNVDQQATGPTHDVSIANNGAITATGSVSNAGGVVNIESESGNIELGGVTADSLNVTANQGNISQTGALAVTDTVTANATTGITLDNTSNEIAALTAASSGTGNITVKTHGGQGLALNNVSTGDGNIDITNIANDIHLNGNLTTGAATNSITLNAGAGILQNSGVISTNKLTAIAGVDNNLDAVGNNIRNYSGSSNTGNISLHNTGTLETFGSTTTTNFNADNRIDLTTTGNLTVGGQINGGTINLTSSGGDIAVNSKVEAAGTATLHAGGGITQTIGISAAALNVIATTGITLNAGNFVGRFSASNSNSGNIAFTNGSAQSLTLGNINNDHGNITVVASGAITTDDTIFAGGNGTVDLTSTGALDMDSGSSITAGTINLTSQSAGGDENINIGGHLTATNGGTITLNSANEISQKQNNNGGDATGNITAGTLNANAVGKVGLKSGGDNFVDTFSGHSDTGNVEFGNNGDLIVKDVSAPLGEIHIAAQGALTVDSGTEVSGTYIALESYSGAPTFFGGEGNEGEGEGNDDGVPPVPGSITIKGQLTATGDNGVSLNTDGGIAQEAGSGISGSMLIANGVNGDIALSAGTNSFDKLYASTFSGNVSVTGSGSFSVGLNNYGGASDIASTNGSITLDNVSASDLTLHASLGAVTQGESGNLQADKLDVHARDGISLNAAEGAVSIGNFSASNTGSGNIALINQNASGQVLTLGTIDNAHGNVSVINTGSMQVASAGAGISAQDITLTTLQKTQGGPVNTDLLINANLAATGTVALRSAEGAITQASGAGITAASLETRAVKGMTLLSDTNAVSAFSAINDDSGAATAAGNIAFKNNSTTTPSQTLTTGVLTNTAGNISIENTGAMVTNGAINAVLGTIGLITHSPLTINGVVNAGGNINFAAGSMITPMPEDNITVNAAVTSTGGAVGMQAGTGVFLNALVTGPGGVNVTAQTYNTTVQQPGVNFTPTSSGSGGGSGGSPGSGTSPNLPITPPSNTLDHDLIATTQPDVNSDASATTLTASANGAGQNNNSGQTVGGGDGEFGGEKDDGKGGKDEKSVKLPMCT